MTKQRRTAPEIIAHFLGWDINEVKELRYQPLIYRSPAIYSIDIKRNGVEYAYIAAPANNVMRPGYSELEWVKLGEEYGRFIFGATGQ